MRPYTYSERVQTSLVGLRPDLAVLARMVAGVDSDKLGLDGITSFCQTRYRTQDISPGKSRRLESRQSCRKVRVASTWVSPNETSRRRLCGGADGRSRVHRLPVPMIRGRDEVYLQHEVLPQNRGFCE